MQVPEADALARLAAHDHGVLCTLHPQRGIDAVPAVYAVHEGFVGIPVDTVKPKAAGRLQRERNLEADPRATLLIEQWDRDDWTTLWWVRAALRWEPAAEAALAGDLAARLASQFAQYRDEPFARILVLRIVEVTGWAAAARGH